MVLPGDVQIWGSEVEAQEIVFLTNTQVITDNPPQSLRTTVNIQKSVAVTSFIGWGDGSMGRGKNANGR